MGNERCTNDRNFTHVGHFYPIGFVLHIFPRFQNFLTGIVFISPRVRNLGNHLPGHFTDFHEFSWIFLVSSPWLTMDSLRAYPEFPGSATVYHEFSAPVRQSRIHQITDIQPNFHWISNFRLKKSMWILYWI